MGAGWMALSVSQEPHRRQDKPALPCTGAFQREGSGFLLVPAQISASCCRQLLLCAGICRTQAAGPAGDAVAEGGQGWTVQALLRYLGGGARGPGGGAHTVGGGRQGEGRGLQTAHLA